MEEQEDCINKVNHPNLNNECELSEEQGKNGGKFTLFIYSEETGEMVNMGNKLRFEEK